MSLSFKHGMLCPKCNGHNDFCGGQFGGPITSVNYKCQCGFCATLLIPEKGYIIEYKAIKNN